MTTTKDKNDKGGAGSWRRPVDRQFVEEDRQRIDSLRLRIADLIGTIERQTEVINNFANNLDFYMREWRQRR